MFKLPQLPLLVFTDLDGTLLDHDDYGFEPARPALTELQSAAVPLIPTTSKTLAEAAVLNRALGNAHPCIIENGGAVCLPDGYMPQAGSGELCCGYRLWRLARPYSAILAVLGELRAAGHRFTGFDDMSAQQIAEHTGLSTPEAELAAQRLCSEPLIWQDSDDALESFRHALAGHGLRLTRGGRFFHVTDDTDKARAMSRLCDLYRQAGFGEFTTVALGDSPNDIEMLENADIAAVIRRKDGSALRCTGRQQTLVSEQPGPAGWNAVMHDILSSIEQAAMPHAEGQTQR